MLNFKLAWHGLQIRAIKLPALWKCRRFRVLRSSCLQKLNKRVKPLQH